MDAIFQNSMDFMVKPLSWFDSYMERASLQLKVELEEYVESTLNTSSSIFITEASDSFLTKLKAAIDLIIKRLKEFIHDTKMNFQKFRKEKAAEGRLERLLSAINKDSKLKELKVKFKDYTPKARFIKREKEAFKRLIRKKGTTKEELKIAFDRYKNELSDFEKAGITISSILAIKFLSTEFLDGLYEVINSTDKSANDTVEDLENIDFSNTVFESATEKTEVTDITDVMTVYARMLSEMATDEIKVQREIMIEIDAVIREIDNEVKKSFRGE